MSEPKQPEVKQYDHSNTPCVMVQLKDVYESEGKNYGPMTVEVQFGPNGIAFHFPGFGDKGTTDLYGQPLFIELRRGVPVVVIHGNIGQEDPTHIISLASASLAYRDGSEE